MLSPDKQLQRELDSRTRPVGQVNVLRITVEERKPGGEPFDKRMRILFLMDNGCLGAHDVSVVDHGRHRWQRILPFRLASFFLSSVNFRNI